MITRYHYLFISIFVFMLFSCSSPKTAANHEPPLLVAWNEDTVNNYQITLMRNKNFYYSVITKQADSLRHPKSYKGTYHFAEDSVLLHFNSDYGSGELAPYLIKEASGNYLIQYFTDNRSRMFLRIQNRLRIR